MWNSPSSGLHAWLNIVWFHPNTQLVVFVHPKTKCALRIKYWHPRFNPKPLQKKSDLTIRKFSPRCFPALRHCIYLFFLHFLYYSRFLVQLFQSGSLCTFCFQTSRPRLVHFSWGKKKYFLSVFILFLHWFVYFGDLSESGKHHPWAESRAVVEVRRSKDFRIISTVRNQ